MRSVEPGGVIRYEFPGMMPVSGIIVAACVFFAVFGLSPLLIGLGDVPVDGTVRPNGGLVALGVGIGLASIAAIVCALRFRSRCARMRFHAAGLHFERETFWWSESWDFTPPELLGMEVKRCFRNNGRPVLALELMTRSQRLVFARGITGWEAQQVCADFTERLHSWPRNRDPGAALPHRISQQTEADGSRRISIRPSHEWPPYFGFLVAGIVFLAVTLAASADDWKRVCRNPREFLALGTMWAPLIFVGMIHELIKSARYRFISETLILGRDSLVLERQWLWRSRREWPRSAIAGATIRRDPPLGRNGAPPPPQLVITTTAKFIPLGKGLHQIQQEWLIRAICGWVNAGRA